MFPSIHPKRLDRPLDSFISPPRATTKPRDYQLSPPDQLLSRTSIRSSRGRSTSSSSLNDQLLFNCTCQAISLLPFPSNNLWRHFCIRNARTYPSTKTYTSYREYLMRLQKLRFYPLAFYFFFFLSLSRVCANARSPRLISPLTTRFFPFPTPGERIFRSSDAIMLQNVQAFRLSFHFFLGRRFEDIRPSAQSASLLPFPKKRKPVHTPIRIIHCVQRVNGNFKCFPPTETYIYIHACHWILLDWQMHRRLPPPGCACVNGGNREQVETKRHRVIRAPLR